MMPTISLDLLEPLRALAPILTTVATAALKGAVLIAFAAVAGATLLRHQPSAVRHALWTAALAAHLVLVFSGAFLPAIPLAGVRIPQWLGVEPRPTTDAPVAVTPSTLEDVIATMEAGSAALAAASAVSAPSVSASLRVVTAASPSPVVTPPPQAPDRAPRYPPVASVWLLGLALVLGRLVLGTVRVRALARAADRVTDPAWLSLAQTIATRLDIARPLTLLRGDRLAIPVTWGVVYPVVLLPAESDDWSDERRRVVLVHEMAHVKRFDALTQILAQIVVAIFWFDPLVWLAARRMRTEREHACDDYVIRDGTRPSHYADALLDMVRRLGDSSRRAAEGPAFAALAMARRSDLEARMRAILDPIANRHVLSRAGALLAGVVAMLLVLPLAALRPADARTLATPMAATATTIPISMPVLPPRDARLRALVASLDSVMASSDLQQRLAAVNRAADAAFAATEEAQSRSREPSPRMYRCTREDVRSRNSTYSMHSDTDKPGGNLVEYYVKRYGRCVHIMLLGPVTFTADERDVASLGANGRVQLHERTLDWERELVVTRADDGRLRRVYAVDGRPAVYDASAQAWVGRLMQDLARESGVAVPERVTRIRGRDGVAGVLAAIAEMEGSSAKRKHYEALLENTGGNSPADVDLIVRHAGRELASSSSDLRAVLRRVPATGARSVTSALADAIGNMSDGDKRETLVAMLDTADAATILAVLRLGEKIGSDGDKASFLQRAAPRAVGGTDAGLREAFFKTYSTIGSDGDKQAVLIAALRQGHKSPALTRDVIRGSSRIGSDGDKASILLAIARDRLLVTDALREEYIKVARSIGSDAEYRQVIDAVLGGKS